jgi:hypothetical protein
MCLGNVAAPASVLNGISNDDFVALSSYLKGGVPTDPQNRDTGCGAAADPGYYLYRFYPDGYLLAASMENLSQANYCTGNVDDFAPTPELRSEVEKLIGPPPATCNAPEVAYYLVIGG